MKEKHKDAADALVVQRHQQENAFNKLGEVKSGIDLLNKINKDNLDTLNKLDAELDKLLSESGVEFDEGNLSVSEDIKELVDTKCYKEQTFTIETLSIFNDADNISWSEYIKSVREYASVNNIDLNKDPFERLLSDTQRSEIEKRINDEFTYKSANCDKYDYMIAGTCGLIGGLIDVLFVGAPDESKLTKFVDGQADKITEKFASLLGWDKTKPEARGSDTTASAIGFLESKFKINYDQATTYGDNGTGGLVQNLSTKNHHLKSLGHSPDIIGLFFSILNQFTNTSSFISEGKIVTINTENSELIGSNFVSKVFCGFANWFGHIMSDWAGSSGAKGRGTGVPIPFYSMLQLFDVGSFGQNKDSFAKVAVKVFEQGYDARHGVALAIPVLTTELLIRLSWSIKQKCFHGKAWSDCIPSAGNPELRRMLLVGHGSLCIIDGVDAGIRSGGEIVTLLLNTNLIAWVRFGSLALKEVTAWYKVGSVDIALINEHLDQEYERLLR
ncbi:conserved hypothetical protein [Denitrovibrio acetiphilus DSM 12809]|jgi:hypothetical protein|uniref:Uncharacterized protein n=1 Tax=Denitrovibrio acetiphilus (strain DSM 12809 / NBRC 114555 / N2460) TaxID=522772 RepID=D4H4J5_DENA2|nr:hypothetical protein [Denitrovibrio acetiphilus]ADD69324.1 conserved hypothetical protein [Denitrovibrio acetiphilus DSM 12809]